ncbi:MMPL family transporter [Haloactinomyces albus]|uniref:RND superfamily putative drug exporter n=1 Tax=Haloactinomyces albus TaxID=1352928 RepID=A0AAE3ZBC2_9ACTN|nr:MMPL family transporter [Haloactinomyces albus]MDR7300526.1 RND superfamily putative drug exporter [Haloactinomyces albus]
MSSRPNRRGVLTEAYASLVVRGRWLLLALVGAMVWAALSFLPALASTGHGLSAVIGANRSALATQAQVIRRFGLPLLAHTAVVQRDPQGLDPRVLARAVQRARTVNESTLHGNSSGTLLFAAPVPNSPKVFPGPNERITTLVTYLFVDPTATPTVQYRAAQDYAARIDHPDDPLLGVSGTIPLRLEQVRLIQRNLLWVEIATVSVIALIVGVNFRSVVAPLITLLTAGIAYFLAVRMVAFGAMLLNSTVPAILEPILVALVLGVTTDYSIFFLSGLRRRLRQGHGSRAATRGTIVEYLPIVLVAGLTVTAGVLVLLVAQTGLFRAFGPGLAVTVATTLVVSVLLVPALLAVLGRWVFWPSRLSRGTSPEEEPSRPPSAPGGGWWIRLLTRRGPAAVVAVVVVGMLVPATLPLQRLRESVLPMSSIPADNSVREAWRGAAAGFAPGILSPTEVIVTGSGVADRTDELARLRRELAARPGVAAVFGPTGELPERPEVAAVPGPIDPGLPEPLRERTGLFLAPGGDAARFLVIFDADPLGALAINHLDTLKRRMPGLLAAAGLSRTSVSYTGDTALALELVNSARGDYIRVALAIALVDLLLLVLFLRALVAPLYLLAASFLALAASLGLTVLLFQQFLGQTGLIFFIPFAVGVLLVSLGADYLIFLVGDVRDAAGTRSLSEALAVAVPRSTRAISAAGITLAASFGVVALVPVVSFRELAFAMAVGVLIDSFVVRPLLVPALITLVGRIGGWPGGRLRAHPAHQRDEESK